MVGKGQHEGGGGGNGRICYSDLKVNMASTMKIMPLMMAVQDFHVPYLVVWLFRKRPLKWLYDMIPALKNSTPPSTVKYKSCKNIK